MKEILDRRVVLSTLWIFAMLNYLYADVMGFFDPKLIPQILSGSVGEVTITPAFLLAAAVLMEIPMVMVLLSRFLPRGPNRWSNMVAAVIKTAAVVGSLFVGTPALYYVFFCVFEVACTLFIFVYALTWKRPQETSS